MNSRDDKLRHSSHNFQGGESVANLEEIKAFKQREDDLCQEIEQLKVSIKEKEQAWKAKETEYEERLSATLKKNDEKMNFEMQRMCRLTQKMASRLNLNKAQTAAINVLSKSNERPFSQPMR